LNDEIEDLEKRVESKTTKGLRYAAVYVLSHLESGLTKEVGGELRHFFESKLLSWIELMSYLGKIYPLLESVHLLSKSMKDITVTESGDTVSQLSSVKYNYNSS
jgi:hypothetical protein